MKDELFNELAASIREGGKILRGKAKPSRKLIIRVYLRCASSNVRASDLS